MAWKTYTITGHETAVLAHNTPGYPDTCAWIKLHGPRKLVTLWFTRSTPSFLNSEGDSLIYVRYLMDQYASVLDTLRNGMPRYFRWNAETKAGYVGSGLDPACEGEDRLPQKSNTDAVATEFARPE